MAVNYTAFEALSVSTTSVGFTSATYGNADFATVQVEGGSVRARFDNTAPTASVGYVFDDGDTIELESGNEIARVHFISVDGGTITLHANFGVEEG